MDQVCTSRDKQAQLTAAIEPLLLNTSYSFGREAADYPIKSDQASRQHLRIDIGSNENVRSTDRTLLTITILSRSRSMINGEKYRLLKNEKSRGHDFTNVDSIDMEFKDSNNPDKMINYLIEWVSFTVFPTTTDTKSSLFNDLKRLHHELIDLRITTDVNIASHCYSLWDIPKGNVEDCDNIYLAMARGLPILTYPWFQMVYEDKNVRKNFQDWFLYIDHKSLLPKLNGVTLLKAVPDSLRSTVLNLFTVFTFNDVLFEESICKGMGAELKRILLIEFFVGGKLNQTSLFHEIKKSTNNCILLSYSPNEKITYEFSINSQLETFCRLYNSRLVEKDMLIKCLQECGIQRLSPLDINHLKHPLEDIAQPTQTRRKRVKYEKVDKMHFFDLDATNSSIETKDTVLSNQLSINEKENQSPNPVIEISPKTSFHSVREKERSPKNTSLVRKELVADPVQVMEDNCESVDDPKSIPEPKENSQIKSEPESPKATSVNNLKRVNSTSDQPKKIQKFMPSYKVSLLTAVQQTKERATKRVEEELGIAKVDEQDLNGSMENLVIVEMIDIPARKNKEVVDDDRYAGRKNFKTFKKNLKVKPSVTRSFVGLEDAPMREAVGARGGVAHSGSLETRLQKQFSGFIDDVVVEKNGLFVESSDEEESIFGSRPISNCGSIPVSNSGSRPISANGSLKINTRNDDDDDDDDDDDGPRFNFSRKR